MAPIITPGNEQASVGQIEPPSVDTRELNSLSVGHGRSGMAESSLWLGVVFLLFGVGYLIKATSYPIGTLANAGPGLFPVMVGIILVIGAAGMVAKAGFARKPRNPITTVTKPSPRKSLSKKERQRLLISAALLTSSVFALTRLGFVVTTAMLSAGVILLVGEKRWRVVVLTSLCLAVGAFFLFRIVLQIQLPTGLL